MANFYTAQSNGKYSVDVTTEDWVTVPGNASTYGDNAVEDDGGSWSFINDTVDAWATTSGKSTADLDAYLPQFDEWDRYDFDEDGDFDEPDGYIDHFQAVHAGEGEEAGADPDAIWSHRWYVNPTTAGSDGPVIAGKPNLNGGARIGNSSYFIGDYTVEPENGGLGVFAHEYGHDLGLPDFYDTNGGDNGTSFWTTMSSGSWLGHGGADEGIGTQPGSFGPEEKLFLGWLKYAEVTRAPAPQGITLSPSEKQVDGAYQAVKVNLEDATTTQAQVDIPGGDYAWWSGRGDDLRNTLTRDVPAASSVTVTADAWYQIEKGYDFLYAQYSVDNGDTWTTDRAPLTGDKTRWGGLRFSYKPGGKASKFRFRYATDGGVNETGAFLDNIVDQGRQDDVHRRRRDRGDAGVGRQGLEALDRHGDGDRQPLLPHREPAVRRLRRHPGAGPVQLLRGRHPAQLGGVLQVPGRHARVARRPDRGRQQHLGAPGLRVRPAGRRDAELVHLRRRHEPDQPA